MCGEAVCVRETLRRVRGGQEKKIEWAFLKRCIQGVSVGTCMCAQGPAHQFIQFPIHNKSRSGAQPPTLLK
jgi:hypothetical protein